MTLVRRGIRLVDLDRRSGEGALEVADLIDRRRSTAFAAVSAGRRGGRDLVG
jgi:hypothetical protein